MKLADKESMNLHSERLVLNGLFFRKISFQLGLIFLFFFAIYAPTFLSLIRMWWGSDDYSHGFLVPLISLYLVWIKREQLKQARIEPEIISGSGLVLLAGLMQVSGKLGSFVILQELSIPVMIAGLVFLLAGKRVLRILAFPIIYLLFMVKIFGEGSDRFHLPFQLLAAKIGIGILHLFGYTAYREDNYIQLPNALLEVAAACSGIRFLVSIVAIGIPLAYLTQRTLARRVGLVLFAVVIAILANGVRVALIGIWTYSHGTAMIHGPFHIFYGVFVSWIGFIALFGGAWYLGRNSRRENIVQNGVKLESQPDRAVGPWNGNRNRSSWIAVLLLSMIAGYSYFYHISPIPLEQGFTGFPLSIGRWMGKDIDGNITSLKVANADSEMRRIYIQDGRYPVEVYIGYFNSQTESKKLMTYTTSWKFHRGEIKTDIPLESGGSYPVNEVVLNEESGRKAVIFWYDLNGKIVASRYIAKIWSMWNALFSGRANAALVVVSIPLDGGRSDLKNIFNDEKEFLKEMMPSLQRFMNSQIGKERT